MTDVKPRRAPRDSGQRESGSRAAAPSATSVPEIVAAAPEMPKMPVPVPVEVAAPAPPASAAVAPPEVAPPEVAPAEDAAAALPDGTASVDDAWAAVVAAQAALARGFEEIAGEVTGMTRSGIAVTADAALALLGARTFAEAVGINAGLAGHRVEAMIEGSVKLSEIGVKAVTEASQPILSRFGAPWGTTGGTTGGATGGAPGGGAGAG